MEYTYSPVTLVGWDDGPEDAADGTGPTLTVGDVAGDGEDDSATVEDIGEANKRDYP